MSKELNNFFEKFLTRQPLFLNKTVIQSNYSPEKIEHRDDQIQKIADILAPSLRLEKPSNLFIYGKTGTGKTLSVKYTTDKILEVAEKKGTPIKIFYLNCKLKKVADTEYRLIAQLARELGKTIPATGLPTDEVYKIFFEALDKDKKLFLVILDEIDQLIKKAGDEILYNLTRINTELKNSQIAIIGISNDLVFADSLDPRVKSSLSEEEIVFPPYNAIQIQDILKQRAKIGFKDGVIEPGVIEKCAAYAAREHGDARRAIELLRVSGEIAERSGKTILEIKDLDEAEDKIERDRILDVIITQPKQHQATLYSILAVKDNKKSTIFTGEVYEVYKEICQKVNLQFLTQRRISDVLAELDMLGIINAKVISKGRYGRTREISLSLPEASVNKIKNLLEEGLDLC